MLQKLERIFLVASIGLIGADRIDLLAGKASFKVTPFLVFGLFLVFTRALRAAFSGTIDYIPTPPMQRQLPFVLGLTLFLTLASLSTIFGVDPIRGLMALADLFLVSILGYCLSVRILADDDPSKRIVQSVTLGLLVYFIFCIGESIAWSNGIIQGYENSGSWIESTFAAKTLFWLPRLSGSTIDANRSGFILVMYLVLLDQFGPKSRYVGFLRFAIGIFILIAVSRSAILCWFVYWIFCKSSRAWLGTWRNIVSVAAVVIICGGIAVEFHQQVANFLDAWQV
jgi:hypothetical protein